MSFTDGTLVKKLVELNSSQQSIQTLSLWVIHHRKHCDKIVKSWFKELQRVPEDKKLTFLYLANDVIQNSKKKGPEYTKEFQPFLSKAFLHIAETCTNHNIFKSLDRLLNIWEQRAVYETEQIQLFRTNLNKNIDNVLEEHDRKRKLAAAENGGSSNSKRSKKEIPKETSVPAKQQPVKPAEKVVANGTEDHTASVDPPEPEELIKAILELENSASSDAVVRGKIANLPPEVSEISLLSKLEDKEAAAKLALQVNDAVTLLNDYNLRLATELDNRKKLAVMLKNCLSEQRDLMAQAEQRLEDYSKKLKKVIGLQKEARNHLHNLPDLKQLPDVTGGLAPLPSAGDLFNIH